MRDLIDQGLLDDKDLMVNLKKRLLRKLTIINCFNSPIQEGIGPDNLFSLTSSINNFATPQRDWDLFS